MNDPDTPVPPPATAVAGDSALVSFTLESLTSAVNYHRWISDLVQPHLGEHPLEVGSGLGDYAHRWIEEGQARVTVSDLDPERFRRLEERFATEPRADLVSLDLAAPPEAMFSALVGINVLEHIEDDLGALRGAHRILRPGGKVVMFVPAFPIAMSEFDRTVGHFRRYRRRGLAALYERAGLTVERVHYVNAPGLLAWIVGMRLLRMTPQDGASVRVWDKWVIPAARAVESRARPPFGQSLLAVGTVPS